jgi:hypothetical protein
MQGEKLIERMQIGSVFGAQAEVLWELSRQSSDLSRAREALSDEARELQRARDHFLSDGSRLILGIACAVLVGFVVAQGVAAWSGIWFSGGSLFRVPLQQAQVISVWAACGLLGVVAGVLLPRYLELRRGAEATRRVQANAEDLRGAMFSLVEARARFCGVTGEVGRAGHAAADYRRAVEIGGHDDRVVARNCPEEFGDEAVPVIKAEAAAKPGSPASGKSAWDVKVFEESSRADIDVILQQSTAANNAAAAEARNDEVYKVWSEGFVTDLHARSGWLSSTKIRATCRKIILLLRGRSQDKRRSQMGTFDFSSSESEAALKLAFERWVDNSGALTPMMSAAYIEAKTLKSCVLARAGGADGHWDKNVETLVALCQGAANSVQFDQDSKFKLPECIPGYVLAEIFQEVSLLSCIETKLKRPPEQGKEGGK